MRVAIHLLLKDTEIDQGALKFFFARANRAQNQIEFVFPERGNVNLPDSFPSPVEAIRCLSLKVEASFEELPWPPDQDQWDAQFFVIDTPFKNNWFSDSLERSAAVTINEWSSVYAPPNVFEYLLKSVIAYCLDWKGERNFRHEGEAVGCLYDFAANTKDMRVSVANGHICSAHKDAMRQHIDDAFVQACSDLLSKRWIGDRGVFGSTAYELQHYFRFNVAKDSGFEKTLSEKAASWAFQVADKTAVGASVGVLVGIALGVLGIGQISK